MEEEEKKRQSREGAMACGGEDQQEAAGRDSMASWESAGYVPEGRLAGLH